MVIKHKYLMKLFWWGNKLHIWDKIPDKQFVKLRYRLLLDRKLNLENPKTFNEKLQWLKLNDHRDIYVTMVDKYESKKYVADRIGSEYIIPTLGVWDRFDDIDFEALPDQFVLKCTHDSGGVVICTNKASFDKIYARKKINESLQRNFYYIGREWPYKKIKPRIIAEKYMVDNQVGELWDYKIQCFNGKPDHILVCYNRNTGKTQYKYFDLGWKFLPYCVWDNPTSNVDFSLSRPEKLHEMLVIAEKLSKGFPELRVDLYYINNKIYFGELTLYSNSGMDADITYAADLVLGEKLKLPR